jgi:hypothetical protein
MAVLHKAWPNTGIFRHFKAVGASAKINRRSTAVQEEGLMALKMITLVKRKPGLTYEQFRKAYEEGHSQLAQKMFGHLWTSYRRYYIKDAANFTAGSGIPGAGQGGECPIDAFSEVTFPDMEAVQENNRIASTPENRRLFAEDEAALFDRVHCWVGIAEEVVDDPQAKYKALNKPGVALPLSINALEKS